MIFALHGRMTNSCFDAFRKLILCIQYAGVYTYEYFKYLTRLAMNAMVFITFRQQYAMLLYVYISIRRNAYTVRIVAQCPKRANTMFLIK